MPCLASRRHRSSVPANSGTYVQMNDLSGARFWSVTSLATSDVQDNFASQAYNLNNGSVNWLSSWTETGDDGAANAGDILINSTSQHLRFITSNASSLNVSDHRAPGQPERSDIGDPQF